MNFTFEEWLKYGWDNGWCSPPVCEIHDGTPMTDTEIQDFGAGDDPCIHIMRLYQTPAEQKEAHNNHAPSQWRAHNRGWSERAENSTATNSTATPE